MTQDIITFTYLRLHSIFLPLPQLPLDDYGDTPLFSLGRRRRMGEYGGAGRGCVSESDAQTTLPPSPRLRWTQSGTPPSPCAEGERTAPTATLQSFFYRALCHTAGVRITVTLHFSPSSPQAVARQSCMRNKEPSSALSGTFSHAKAHGRRRSSPTALTRPLAGEGARRAGEGQAAHCQNTLNDDVTPSKPVQLKMPQSRRYFLPPCIIRKSHITSHLSSTAAPMKPGL
jgi:hypothetical protein